MAPFIFPVIETNEVEGIPIGPYNMMMYINNNKSML